MWKKDIYVIYDIYVNRLESVIFGIKMCTLQTGA